jgi:hypothetical protein
MRTTVDRSFKDPNTLPRLTGSLSRENADPAIREETTRFESETIGYNELADIIKSLQLNNERLNSSLRMVQRMKSLPRLQCTLRKLRAADFEITEFVACILADVHPDFEE